MKIKFTSALAVMILACVGGVAAASVGMGRPSQDAIGTAALSGVQTVESAGVDIPAGSSASVRAYCPSGKVVIGTGFFNSITNPAFVKAYGTFVGGFFFNNTSITITVHVQAICASDTAGVSSLSGSMDFERDVRQISEQWKLKRLDAK